VRGVAVGTRIVGARPGGRASRGFLTLWIGRTSDRDRGRLAARVVRDHACMCKATDDASDRAPPGGGGGGDGSFASTRSWPNNALSVLARAVARGTG
jgi:hypothetical protein